MMRSPLFWMAVGAVGYWGFQRFTGAGRVSKGA
jgi:hypothetical protein